jgi:hypothetical protein
MTSVQLLLNCIKLFIDKQKRYGESSDITLHHGLTLAAMLLQSGQKEEGKSPILKQRPLVNRFLGPNHPNSDISKLVIVLAFDALATFAAFGPDI